MSENVTKEQGKAVPLVERLRRVPSEAVHQIHASNPLGVDTTNLPVGALCREAADFIEQSSAPAAAIEQGDALALLRQARKTLHGITHTSERMAVAANIGAFLERLASPPPGVPAPVEGATDLLHRRQVLLILEGMGEEVDAKPSTPGAMALHKGIRMAIGTAMDRVKQMPGADEGCSFMGEPVSPAAPVASAAAPGQVGGDAKPDPKNCTALVSCDNGRITTKSCTTGKPLIDKGGSTDGERDYYECPDCGKRITIDYREN